MTLGSPPYYRSIYYTNVMINYIYSIFISKNQNIILLKCLIVLCILFIFIISMKWANYKILSNHEGFTQNDKFILKQQHQVYDEFYAEIYDEINPPTDRINFELKQILQTTNPSSQNSVFLEVGSGTGALVNELQQAGYYAYGIDKSNAMVNYSEKKYNDIQIKCGDANDSITYELGTFTHILCTDNTIYQFVDKLHFLKNCYFWLKPYGYLILHLVDSQKLDTKKHNIDFTDFEYSYSYNIPKNNKELTFTETFTDKNSSKIRQNEQTIYMESREHIIALATACGFNSYGMANLFDLNGDKNQFIYILQRH